MNNSIRTFETGATRTADTGKPDYEGYLSPAVLKEFGKYMTKHRNLPDGSVRDSDNWQKGISHDVYMKSLLRHVFDLWSIHRDGFATDHRGQSVSLEDTLSAILFNTQGYFHEQIKSKSDVCLSFEEQKALEDAPLSKSKPSSEEQKALDTLERLGCPVSVAEDILNGISFADSFDSTKSQSPSHFIYIAGPMRGHPNFNFPAFDIRRDLWLMRGYNVISPADIDRCSEINVEQAYGPQADFALRDFWAIRFVAFHHATAPESGVDLLPGWVKSKGAASEFFLARWLGIRTYSNGMVDPEQVMQDFCLENF